jgi:hypothetical protein
MSGANISEAEKHHTTPIAERPPIVKIAAKGSYAEKILAKQRAAKKTTGGRRTRRRGARKSRRGNGKGKSRRRGRSKKRKYTLL